MVAWGFCVCNKDFVRTAVATESGWIAELKPTASPSSPTDGILLKMWCAVYVTNLDKL